MSVEHVAAELGGQPCKIYFFARWSTYAHPVTPHEPLYLEQALLRKNFYRAWTCQSEGQTRFVLFEAVANELSSLDGTPLPGADAETPTFLALIDGTNGPNLGPAISAAQAFERGAFGLRFAHGAAGSFSVRQRVNFSYHYAYRADGRLQTATITNPEGRVNVLQY